MSAEPLADCSEDPSAWARDLLARADWCILDTETTGLDGQAEVIQVAVLAPDGTTLLDTLLRPAGPVPADATKVHGITDGRLAGAPTLSLIYPRLEAGLRDRVIVAYNAAFDRRLLAQTYARYGLMAPLSGGWVCAMEAYAAYVGEWTGRRGRYRWHTLPGGGHDALGDCRATLALLRAMAGWEQV